MLITYYLLVMESEANWSKIEGESRGNEGNPNEGELYRSCN